MLKAPELWGGSSEAKANFGSAALFLTQVNDLAVLLLTVGNISQDNPFVQSDGLRQSEKTTMSTKYDSARGIRE